MYIMLNSFLLGYLFFKKVSRYWNGRCTKDLALCLKEEKVAEAVMNTKYSQF